MVAVLSLVGAASWSRRVRRVGAGRAHVRGIWADADGLVGGGDGAVEHGPFGGGQVAEQDREDGVQEQAAPGQRVPRRGAAPVGVGVQGQVERVEPHPVPAQV